MSGISAKREDQPPAPAGDSGVAFARLVELQKEIVQLVDQNTAARQDCLLLRQQVAREAEELFARSRSLPRRTFRAARRALRQFLDRFNAPRVISAAAPAQHSTAAAPASSHPSLRLLPSPQPGSPSNPHPGTSPVVARHAHGR